MRKTKEGGKQRAVMVTWKVSLKYYIFPESERKQNQNLEMCLRRSVQELQGRDFRVPDLKAQAQCTRRAAITWTDLI